MPPRRSARSSRSHGEGHRTYARVARVNESLREVIAEELELIDDDRLQLVTVTGVVVEPDFRRATVWFSALTTGADLDDVGEALLEHRVRIQGAIGRQVRLKQTPALTFRPDPAILEGDRIESIIRTMPRMDPEAAAEAEAQARAEEEAALARAQAQAAAKAAAAEAAETAEAALTAVTGTGEVD